MTEILVLVLLSALALAGIVWTAWDIRIDLRRRGTGLNKARISRQTHESPPADKPAGIQ